MIYTKLETTIPASQGDILDECPVLVWTPADAPSELEPGESRSRVVIVTQSCDMAQAKTSRVLVAAVYNASELVEAGVLKASTIRDQVRLHRVYGWYFLPTGPAMDESIVNLHELHTVPRNMVDSLIANGKRICRLVTPYREHMAQHFSTTYSRIGLPLPYDTDEQNQN